MDFLSNFNRQYKQNKQENGDNIKRFEKGLEKLHESGEKISILKQKIDKKMINVKSSKDIVEKMLSEIKETSEKVEKEQKIAKEKSEQLAVENEEIQKNQKKADSIL